MQTKWKRKRGRRRERGTKWVRRGGEPGRGWETQGQQRTWRNVGGHEEEEEMEMEQAGCIQKTSYCAWHGKKTKNYSFGTRCYSAGWSSMTRNLHFLLSELLCSVLLLSLILQLSLSNFAFALCQEVQSNFLHEEVNIHVWWWWYVFWSHLHLG